MRTLLSISLVLLACRDDKPRKQPPTPPAPPAAAKPTIVGKTGPVEMLAADGAPMNPYTIAEYKQQFTGTQKPVLVATKFPDKLSPTAGAGVNFFAQGKNVSWVIDGDPKRGFWLAYDENANGDLSDDARRDLKDVSGAWELTVTFQVEGVFSGQLLDAPARIRLRVKEGEMRIQRGIVRRGELALPTGPMAFALIGDTGQFGLDHHYIAFDLDRNGKLDLESLDNPELFHVFEKTITIDNASYAFELGPDGAQLGLRPLPDKIPARAPLTTGTPAPDISVTDLDGKPATLSGLKGKVVLIDFWSTDCQPCVKALPRLAELRAKLHPRGFELMSIAAAADDVRETLGTHRAGISAISDAAQADYRVDRFPMYFLVDRDGKIACSRCQLDALEKKLTELIP